MTRRPRPPRRDATVGRLKVTLFGRPGCHLCEQAAEMLADIGRVTPLDVEEVNIESDDALLARYVWAIPVVVADGEELARAPVQRGVLEDAIERVAGRQAR